MQYIGSNIRFIFTKIKELLNSHNTDNSAHSELFKSWKRLRNPNNADIADALAATYKNGIGDVLVEVKDDTTFALEDMKLFFRPASFKLISANESNYEGIYITMDGTQGRYVAKTFADSEVIMPEGPTIISTPSELALYPAASDAVLYTPQTLTEEQQAQARTNIGALDVNIKTTPVDIGVGLGSTVYYVQSGWLRPCPDNADKELKLQYRRVFEFIGSRRIEPSSQNILLEAKSAYALYQKGLASESIVVTNNPLRAAQVYVNWNLTTRNNKHYFYYAQVATAYYYDCTYCVEDDALTSERYQSPVYRTAYGVGGQDRVSQFRMSAAPTEDMHIATKQYVDTTKTEAQQLGLTAATPGQIIKVKTVDEQGSPTAWEAVDDRLPKVSVSDAGNVLGVEQIGEHEYGYALTHMPTLNDFIPLGITNASPGQFAKVSFVDDFGNPTAWEAADIYEKPDTGIPKTDLAGDVQTSLAKADTAISYNSQTLTDEQKSQARTNIGVGQPDWNQNDSTQPDYVKNRPFYTGNPVETVLVEESTVTFAAVDSMYMGQLESTFSATIGETYKVSWDGAAYECTCVSFNGEHAIGNLSIVSAGSDTGEPFIIGIRNGVAIQIVTADTSASHTFSISGFVQEVVKIDAKYLPNTVATKSEVEAAQTTAENAQTTAENAQTTADNAQTTANNAQTTANAALPKAGGNMTGSLVLKADPTAKMEAATKQYVDANKFTGEYKRRSDNKVVGINNFQYSSNVAEFYYRATANQGTTRCDYYLGLHGKANLSILCFQEGHIEISVSRGEAGAEQNIVFTNGNKSYGYGGVNISGIEGITMFSSSSSGPGRKKFRITVDDNGVPTITDESDSTNTWKPTNLPTVTSSDSGKFLRVSDTGKWVAETILSAYEKPDTGIPKSDLEQSVQTSLAKADTSISYDSQTLTEAQQKQARDNIGAGQPVFAVNVTEVSEGGGYTADKTAAEIEAAYQAGRTIVCKTQARFMGGQISAELPLVSRTQERFFIFIVDQLVRNGIFAINVTISDSGVEVSTDIMEIYKQPVGGIPKSDLADDVQTSLAKADTAISLGLTAATPGQIIKVKTVQDGKPTEWEAVDMDAGKFPKFQKLLTHTITEDELAASPIAFMWGTAQIPNLNDFNVFVLTIVRPDGAKIEFSKWVKLKINNTLFGNICGTSTAASPQYTITANRLFGVWISGNYYDPRNIGVPVLVPPRSSSTYHSDLPDSEPVTSIGFTSYVADYGLTAGIVVEIWGAK